jgi:hypothetical protein
MYRFIGELHVSHNMTLLGIFQKQRLARMNHPNFAHIRSGRLHRLLSTILRCIPHKESRGSYGVRIATSRAAKMTEPQDQENLTAEPAAAQPALIATQALAADDDVHCHFSSDYDLSDWHSGSLTTTILLLEG